MYSVNTIFDYTGSAILISIFIFLLIIEAKYNLREVTRPHIQRLKRNASIGLISFIVLRAALIPGVIFAAILANHFQTGILNWLKLPSIFTYIVGFLLLDYLNYIWHIINHRVNFLWRFHNVHHIDLDLDVSTAFRFHFGEILLSVIFKGLVVFIIGPPINLVLIYEIVFEAGTAFHHSNWKLPIRFEKILSLIIVSPRMHGIHHSIIQRETNSNYSTVFNLWDRIHKTLKLNIPQSNIIIGTPSYRKLNEQTILKLILLPFQRQREWKFSDGSVPERRTEKYTSDLKE